MPLVGSGSTEVERNPHAYRTATLERTGNWCGNTDYSIEKWRQEKTMFKNKKIIVSNKNQNILIIIDNLENGKFFIIKMFNYLA